MASQFLADDRIFNELFRGARRSEVETRRRVAQHGTKTMIRVPISCHRSLPGRLTTVLGILELAALFVTGCQGTMQNPVRAPKTYVVFFTATRSSDHEALFAVSLPVKLGGEASIKTSSRSPAENLPALPEFDARLKRLPQPGVYELVTRVAVREAIRNKKGKLKITKRFLGALVPTHLGEAEVVSTESDPIHLEARLERR